jgi:hypothetical protein
MDSSSVARDLSFGGRFAIYESLTEDAVNRCQASGFSFVLTR